MYNPITEYNNKFQNFSTVTNQPNISNDKTFLLNTITKTVPALPSPPLVSLEIADTYSLSTTQLNSFQTSTKQNATVNPSQTLYQSLTAPIMHLLASSTSSSSVPIVKPINTPAVNAEKSTVPFVARTNRWKRLRLVEIIINFLLEKIQIKLWHMQVYHGKTTASICSF